MVRNNFIPTSADSWAAWQTRPGPATVSELLLSYSSHYPSEHRSACAEEVSCQGAARHLESSCTGTGSCRL